MAFNINIDRFTRMNQSISGKFAPGELPQLAEYLAGEEGEINYSMVGSLSADLTGGQVRRVKCIIYGWFLLFDPVSLAASKHALEISSSLIIVNNESSLPPLEMESETEDYIVCGANMHVADRIAEEILLSLPAQTVKRSAMIELGDAFASSESIKSAKPAAAKVSPAAGSKISPFAKLARLKKK